MLSRGVLHARRERYLLRLNPVPGVVIISPSISEDVNHIRESPEQTGGREGQGVEPASENRSLLQAASQQQQQQQHGPQPTEKQWHPPEQTPSEAWLTWNVLTSGLPNRDYGDACFRLQLAFDEYSPTAPPRVRFLTIPYHPNIHPVSGVMSMPELEQWTASGSAIRQSYRPSWMSTPEGPTARDDDADIALPAISAAETETSARVGSPKAELKTKQQQQEERQEEQQEERQEEQQEEVVMGEEQEEQLPSYVHLLRSIQCLLSIPDLATAVNAPAANLYRYKRTSYQRFVQQCTQASLRVHAGLPPHHQHRLRHGSRQGSRRGARSPTRARTAGTPRRPRSPRGGSNSRTLSAPRQPAVVVDFDEYRREWKRLGATPSGAEDADLLVEEVAALRGGRGATYAHTQLQQGQHRHRNQHQSASLQRRSTSPQPVSMWPHPAARSNILVDGSLPGSAMGKRISASAFADLHTLWSAPVAGEQLDRLPELPSQHHRPHPHSQRHHHQRHHRRSHNDQQYQQEGHGQGHSPVVIPFLPSTASLRSSLSGMSMSQPSLSRTGSNHSVLQTHSEGPPSAHDSAQHPDVSQRASGNNHVALRQQGFEGEQVYDEHKGEENAYLNERGGEQGGAQGEPHHQHQHYQHHPRPKLQLRRLRLGGWSPRHKISNDGEQLLDGHGGLPRLGQPPSSAPVISHSRSQRRHLLPRRRLPQPKHRQNNGSGTGVSHTRHSHHQQGHRDHHGQLGLAPTHSSGGKTYFGLATRPSTSQTDAEADELISWAGQVGSASPMMDDDA